MIFCYVLLFELSLLFKIGQWKFLFWQKNRGHFWTLFWSKIWQFFLKNQIFGHFLRIRTSGLKLGQKLGTIALNHRMTVLCLWKFLFWPFLGQKYIACGDFIWFWAVFWPFSSKSLMIFCYFLLFKLSLSFKSRQWNFLFWQKNRGHFWTLFWSKIWPFLLKNQIFGHFLRNCTSGLSKASSETGDNCFESSNGSVVSVKILV